MAETLKCAKQLFCLSTSGVADRIRLLIAGRKLAEELGRQFTHIWLRNHDAGCCFADVFSADNIRVMDFMPEFGGGVVYFDGHHLSREPWAAMERTVALAHLKENDAVLIHSFANDQPHDLEGNGIRFSSRVLERKAALDGDSAALDIVGCHVRMSDYQEFAHHPALDEYFAAVDGLLKTKDAAIFLACHTTAVREAFHKRYGSRVMKVPWTMEPNRVTRQGMVDAMAELAVLRQCRRLALSIFSGFSAMAIKGPRSVKGAGIAVIEDNV